MHEPQNQIFRKVALDRLSSPEQLDHLMRVTSPKGWVALTACGAVLLAALVWSVYGIIPTMVEGHGILMSGGAIYDVVSSGAGVVTEVTVKVNDSIPAQHVVARISQPELELKIKNSELELSDLQEQNRKLVVSEDETLRIDLLSFRQERTNLLATLESYRVHAAALEKQVTRQREALKAGLIVESAVLASEIDQANVEQERAKAELRLTQIRAAEVDRPMQLEQQRAARRQRIDEAARGLEFYRRQWELSSVIRSPYAGRVLELTVDEGNLVSSGSRVLSLEQVDAELSATLYIPAAEGKRVEKGMQVRLSPSTVRKEEAGFILGHVTFVSRFPATSEGMQRTLRNQDLVRQLSGEGPPIKVGVGLLKAPRGGYRWSSTRASPPIISSGTLCSGSIVIASNSPISLVIPLVRGTFGN